MKHTGGIFLDEACGFKAGDDLDDLCARLETHFKKHGLDTNNPNDTNKMMSEFHSHPLFTVESIKVRNVELVDKCDDIHDKQNNDDATKCFMNSSE